MNSKKENSATEVTRTVQGAFEKDAMSAKRFMPKPEAIPFIVERLIPKNTVGAISATGGVGKSTFAIQLSIDIALSGVCNRPFLGSFEVGYAQKVLYLSGEDTDIMNHHKIYQNMKHIASEANVSEELLWDTLGANLLIPDLSGINSPISYVNKGVVKPTEMFENIKRCVHRFKPDVIFLDTKSRFSGVPENDNGLVAQEISLLESLVKPFGSNLIIIHHTPKSNLGSARGASSFTDNLRWIINLTPSNEVKNAVVVTNTKQNYGKPVSQFTVKRNDGYLFEATSSVIDDDYELIDIIVEEILNQGNEGYTQSQVVEMVRARKEGASKRAIMTAVKFGLSDGKLKNNGAKNGMKLAVNDEWLQELEINN